MVERKKTTSEILRRYLTLLLGILFCSLGTTITIKSGIGAVPVITVPATLSLIFTNLSIGTWVIICNLILILVHFAVRKRRLKKRILLLQFFTAVALGIFTDLSMDSLEGFAPKSYRGELFACMSGGFVLAGGLYLARIANVGRMPLESFLKFIAKLWGKKYFLVRLLSDVIFATVAGGLGALLLESHDLLREGTVLTVFFTIVFMKLFSKSLREFSYFILPENKEKKLSVIIDDSISESQFVLTVSHEYGSGGRTIAKRIAHELNLPYYDRDVLQLEELNQDETSYRSIFDWSAVSFEDEGEKRDEELYKIEAQFIQHIAAKDSCVIVGRLSNYVLQNHKNSLHIFITADEDERIKRVMRKEGVDEDEAVELIKKNTREQERHFQRLSENKWGNGENYDIMIKSSKYGVDRTAAILLDLIKEFRLMQV